MDFKNKVENFIKELSLLENSEEYAFFNPWRDCEDEFSIKNGAEIRRENLKKYLLERENAEYILIAQDLSYCGGRFTGIAMTSEACFYEFCDKIFNDCNLEKNRTSALDTEEKLKELNIDNYKVVLNTLEKKDNFSYIKKYEKINKNNDKEYIEFFKNYGILEKASFIVWPTMLKKCGDSRKWINWNIFPFHNYNKYDIKKNSKNTTKYEKKGPLSNVVFRILNQKKYKDLKLERDKITKKYLKEFLNLFKNKTIILIGNESKGNFKELLKDNSFKELLDKNNLLYINNINGVRHPSYGGAKEFEKDLDFIIKNK